MAEKLIGQVTHYFDKLGVAVLKLKGTIKVGDTLRFEGGEINFEQTMDSMQIDRKPVNKAKKGDDVGMKVNEKVRPGYRVFLVK
ncbi:hypothetical protein HQ571_03360 [Candidatus Kuenenbacteria bacterium]|nr:hypothetical protein [Candidatus Kuenenbacteria bacterium]